MKLRQALIPLLLLYSARAGAIPYTIDKFHSDIILNRDSSVNVTETIEVTFNEARHGIFRFIPISYTNDLGLTQQIDLRLLGVDDGAGHAYPTAVTHPSGNINIRIGDPNITFSPGTQKTYRIRYEVFGAINWFEHPTDWQPYAELYMNVTGDQWDTPIGESSFVLRFPSGDNKTGNRMRVYKGWRGSKTYDELTSPAGNVAGQNTGLVLSMDVEAKGEMKGALNPGSGITLVFDLPASQIEKPKLLGLTNLRRYVLPNLGFTTPIAVLLVMGLLWFFIGRDPLGGPIMVRYEPPDELSGPELGALIDEKVDQRDLAAGFVSLAVKGRLKIKVIETAGVLFKSRNVELHMTEKDRPESKGGKNEPLTRFEERLLQMLQDGGEVVNESDIRTHVASRIADLEYGLYYCLVKRGYFPKSPSGTRTAWTTAGILGGAIFAFICFLIHPARQWLPSFAGGIAGIFPAIWIARWMPKRTAKGLQAQREALGFYEVMKRACKEELDWISKNHPEQAFFEKYLPHAVALGLTSQWSEAFKNSLTECPDWYVGPVGQPFIATNFGSDFQSTTSHLASVANDPPRASSGSGWAGSGGFSDGGGGFSDGGGSSGGGSGGGGGGSW
ncbi:DUF2207 domain-containing protein [Candidatus Sumerlaeota bacterium]|nr:DUF2207 domain-containing protein [Candidatus Sumerlaeota bacterium]